MKPKTTPKDFFLWLGAMIALYVSTFSFLNLFFEYIDKVYPDQLSGYVDPYSSSIRFSIASLIVFFPVFLLLMRLIRRDIARNPEKKDLWVRRWALYLTLFVAGATVVIDLVTLINTYLGGDLTTRFILKVVLVFLVVGAGFLHFLADLRGHWEKNPSYSRFVAWGSSLLVIATVVSGVFIIGTPGQVRLYRFDEQKVSDLQNIQWQIVNFWQQKGKLPQNLDALNDPISGFSIPKDPQTQSAYEYGILGPTSFQLCASFNAITQDNSPEYRTPIAPVSVGATSALGNNTWEHAAGRDCFLRAIDPQKYPTLKKV